MTPQQQYQHQLTQPGFVADAAQARAVEHLQGLYEQLIAQEATTKPWWARVQQRMGWKPSAAPRGIYFYGGVGRGKTHLMDLFYNSLPFAEKWRSHFHRFMRDVHDRRATLGNREDPLQDIAKAYAQQYRVICFDEFLVNDIADAMILGRLLHHLYGYGVTLVATSNVPPADLYRDGFQRDRFLPAILALEAHNHVICVDGGVDYRLRTLQRAPIYHAPAGNEADRALTQLFDQLATGRVTEAQALIIDGRSVMTRRHAESVVWFDFSALCVGPRGAADYIEIAACYPAVMISNIPQLTAEHDDQARRFITLIDELYDRHVDLIASASVMPEHLYTGTRLQFEFQRTTSRLQEMQTEEYLARPHLG
jgi:cell division protein ZapE